MSQRNMYNCQDCESVFVVTVVETADDKHPTFCVICQSDKILKIEPNNE